MAGLVGREPLRLAVKVRPSSWPLLSGSTMLKSMLEWICFNGSGGGSGESQLFSGISESASTSDVSENAPRLVDEMVRPEGWDN